MDDQPLEPVHTEISDPPGAPAAGNILEDQAAASEVLQAEALARLRKAFRDQAPQAVTEIIHAYLCEAPMLLEKMHLALENAQAQPLKNSAHTLKSSSALLGADRLSGLCQALESLAQSEDLSCAGELVAQLSAEYARVDSALHIELLRLS